MYIISDTDAGPEIGNSLFLRSIAIRSLMLFFASVGQVLASDVAGAVDLVGTYQF